MSSRAARAVEAGARFVQLLRRRQPCLRQLLRAIERDAGVLEVRLRRGALRFRGGDGGFGLLDLIAELPLLQAQRRLALAHLRREAFGAVFVIGALGLKLAGLDLGDQLPVRDRVAFLDAERDDPAADLRRSRRRRASSRCR